MTLQWAAYLVVCAVIWLVDRRLTARRRRQELHTSAPRAYQGPAGPVRITPQNLINPTPTESPLLPPDGNWCGCCGRPCAEPWLWCNDCLFHITLEPEALHERTWFAQHGTICPFTDLDEGDVAPEGVARPLQPSHVSEGAEWSAAERDLFDECQRGITA